jgi:hypothetical protein
MPKPASTSASSTALVVMVSLDPFTPLLTRAMLAIRAQPSTLPPCKTGFARLAAPADGNRVTHLPPGERCAQPPPRFMQVQTCRDIPHWLPQWRRACDPTALGQGDPAADYPNRHEDHRVRLAAARRR